jgi:hypothetical protein
VVSVLALDPRFMGSNVAEDDGFLRVIKIYNMTSFRGNVKLSVSSCKILHVTGCYNYERDTSETKLIVHFFAKFLLLCY